MDGGTTFHFVTDGIETCIAEALARGSWRAGRLDRRRASTAQQYQRAGLIDELEIHVVPVFLGGGERVFENLDGGPAGYDCVELVSSPAVAHYRYVRTA